MRAHDPTKAVQMLDLLLECFADGANWTQGVYLDGDGRSCIVGALDYLHRQHRLTTVHATYFLKEAMPLPRCELVHFNDRRCRSFADLRSLIVKARALAVREPERRRAVAAAERWLLAEVERERTARAAAGDERPTYILCPRTAAELALLHIEEASLAKGFDRPVHTSPRKSLPLGRGSFAFDHHKELKLAARGTRAARTGSVRE